MNITVSPGQPVPAPPEGFRTERMVALVTAVIVVGVVLYLVLRNEAFASPNLVVILRIVIALAVGVLGATIPGFLQVDYNGQGMAIRAGGALALFVLTFFGTPHVSALKLSAAEVEMDRIRQVDIRTSLGPDATAQERLDAPAYVTVPVSIRSIRQPSARATLDRTVVMFEDAAGKTQRLEWRNFVTMHEERYSVWLGIESDAHPVSIDSGDILYREILHATASELRWRDAMKLLESSQRDTVEFKVAAHFGDQVIEQLCTVDARYWGSQLAQFRSRSNSEPGRVTMPCLDSSRG